MTAVIEKVAKGKLKGQFRFKLIAANGKTVGQSYPETYTSKQGLIDTLESCFPSYEIVDLSDKANANVILIDA